MNCRTPIEEIVDLGGQCSQLPEEVHEEAEHSYTCNLCGDEWPCQTYISYFPVGPSTPAQSERRATNADLERAQNWWQEADIRNA